MHEPGTLTVDASIVDQMIAGREEIIKRLEAENAHLRQELAPLTESANKDRDILNAVVEAVSRREK